MGVSCANTTHLQVATLSRTNEITVKVPHLKRNIQSLSIVAKPTNAELSLYPDRKGFIEFYFTANRRMTLG